MAAIISWTLSGSAFANPSADPAELFGPRLITLSLHVDEAGVDSLKAKPESPVAGTLTSPADPAHHYGVTLHIKGQLGSARPLEDKPAFKITFAKDDRFFGREHLTLNNMVQDPTMVHEALGYQVYAAAGVPVPATSYVQLIVNDEPYGLYLNVETVDRAFLARRFGNSTGILYEGNYGADLRPGDDKKFQLHEGDDPGAAQLRALIDAVNAPGDGVLFGPAAQVDTGSFLAMMAAEALLDDWDNYYQSNNYRLYWQPDERLWHFIPTGIDQTFGGHETSTTVFGATGLLFQKCLASDRCVRAYAAAVRSVADRFQRLGLATRMDALLSVIDAAVAADSRRPYDDAKTRAGRESMRAFIDARPADVVAALSCLDDTTEPAFVACTGAVVIAPSGGCLEIVSRTPAQNGAGVRLAPCLGGVKQRWHVVQSRSGFKLRAWSTNNCLAAATADEGARIEQTACTGDDHQLIVLGADQRLSFKRAGKCLGPGPENAKAPLLALRSCSDADASWHLQRSVLQ